MNYISESEYKEQLNEIKRENQSKKRKQDLKKEKRKYSVFAKLPSTSKMMAVYLFVLLNVVLCYAMFMMWRFQDLQCLSVLITDVVAQVLTYFIYSRKATIENQKNGITYELAMMDRQTRQDTEDIEQDDSVG